jgi:uncharacterized protein (TIGR03437 family)
LNTSRLFLFAAVVALLLSAPAAFAQTPANISVVSGNGQFVCFGCPGVSVDFRPLVVKVTDASGNPVGNATVTWTSTAGTGFLVSTQTTTDGTGTSQNFYIGSGSNSLAGSGAGPFQASIIASIGTASVTFTESSAAGMVVGATNLGPIVVPVNVYPDLSKLPGGGATVSATAGTQGFSFNGVSGQSFVVGISSNIAPLAGVNIRLVNYQTNPTVSCVTGPGADPGSVLTDTNGYATCVPTFTGSGHGVFQIDIGGTPDDNFNNDTSVATFYGLYQTNPESMQVTAATPSAITVVSGNNQTATAGNALSSPLVVKVTGSGGSLLSGQHVSWTANPVSAVAFSNATTATDQNGQSSNTLTLAAGASGVVTITATVTGSSVSTTFSVTAYVPVTITGLTKVSGDSQSAVISTAFASPLVVQVSGSGSAAAAGVAVQFTATSGVTLSASSVNTDSSGRAQVTVTAGSTPGTSTVTASAGNYTQTFTLTVSGPGPSLTASSFVNAADLKGGSISPCSIATVMASGAAGGVQGLVNYSPLGLGAWPTTLSNETVTVNGVRAPILSLGTPSGGQQQVTFQVPCATPPGSNSVTIAVGAGTGTTSVNVQPASPGVFQTQSQVLLGGSFPVDVPLGVFVRPDGTFVSASNPARKGEIIVTYATGLGPTTQTVDSNALPVPGSAVGITGTVIVGLANGGVPLSSIQLSPDLVGVYAVAFQVPTSIASGNQVFSIGVTPVGSSTTYYSAGCGIPVQ